MNPTEPPSLHDIAPRLAQARDEHERGTRLRTPLNADDELSVRRAAAALVPLFRHGGSAGTGISYGFNASEDAYGIWDHEGDDWFPGQRYAASTREIDGPAFFAERALRAAGALGRGSAPTGQRQGDHP